MKNRWDVLGYGKFLFLPELRESPLPAKLMGAGQELKRRGDRYVWSGRNRLGEKGFIFQYTLSGEGCLRRSGKTYRLSQGKAMILPIPDEHVYYFPENLPEWRYLYLTLGGSAVEEVLAPLVEKSGGVVALPSVSPPVLAALEIAERAKALAFTSDFEAGDHSWRFVMALCGEVWGRQSVPERRPAFLVRVLHHLENRYHTELSTEAMAALAGLSREHFCRSFESVLGIAPARYLQRLRIQKSLDLLSSGTQSVAEVAGLCGFSERAVFTRAFRKWMGMSPAAFAARPVPGRSTRA